jgi:hypothetical protein
MLLDRLSPRPSATWTKCETRFVSPKKAKVGDIHTDHESLYGAEVRALPTVKKWWKRFQQGRTDLFDDSRSGEPKK